MPKTNLQTLTAEELASIISETLSACEYCIYVAGECPNDGTFCEENIYKWLMSKAEKVE